MDTVAKSCLDMFQIKICQHLCKGFHFLHRCVDVERFVPEKRPKISFILSR